MVLDVSCMDTAVDVPHDGETLNRDTTLYCLPEYQEDIHDYLRDAELRFRPKVSILCRVYTTLVICENHKQINTLFKYLYVYGENKIIPCLKCNTQTVPR